MVMLGALPRIPQIPGEIREMSVSGYDWPDGAAFSFRGAVIGRMVQHFPFEGL
jgi:hypothetical protein